MIARVSVLALLVSAALVATLSHARPSCHVRGKLPDPVCSPGALNPAVTQATIHSTICVPGWTKTVRPSTRYTNSLKAAQIKAYGYSDTKLADYEEDHVVPLEVGGAPSDPRNLWPESPPSPNAKDRVENLLHAEVCAGRVTLATAQREIAKDWTAVHG